MFKGKRIFNTHRRRRLGTPRYRWVLRVVCYRRLRLGFSAPRSSSVRRIRTTIGGVGAPRSSANTTTSLFSVDHTDTQIWNEVSRETGNNVFTHTTQHTEARHLSSRDVLPSDSTEILQRMVLSRSEVRCRLQHTSDPKNPSSRTLRWCALRKWKQPEWGCGRRTKVKQPSHAIAIRLFCGLSLPNTLDFSAEESNFRHLVAQLITTPGYTDRRI